VIIQKLVQLDKKILMEISTLMNININKLSLKGTSTEDQGFINTKNGIAAQAIISIEVPKYER
jgi:2C-methyl-D-erythritol 2,4-cyclodiphosphate synthase